MSDPVHADPSDPDAPVTPAPDVEAPAPVAGAPGPQRSFAFARDGQRIAVAVGERLEIFQIESEEPPRSLPTPPPIDFAAFDDDVWVVARAEEPEAGPQLQRYTLAGRRVGEPVALPAGGPGRLVPCPFGSPSAIWLGASAVEIRDDLGQLQVTEVASRYDHVIPLGARRWAIARANELILRGPGGDESLPDTLLGHARVVDGAALFEARSLALLVEREEAEHELLVVAPRGGILQHRLRLAGITCARFASQRGYVLFREGRNGIILVDLRFGKVLKHLSEPKEILDLDLDGAAQHIALRLRGAGGHVGDVYTTYRDLLAAQSIAMPPAPVDDDEAPAPPEPDAEAAPAAMPTPASRPSATVGTPVAATPTVARAATPMAARAAAPATEPAAPATDVPPPDAASPVTSPIPTPPPEPELPPLPEECPRLPSLLPRSPLPLCPRQQALALLDRHLELVGAWCERAIAQAWDTGQIVYPTDTGHPFEKEVTGILGRSGGNARQQLAAAEARVGELSLSLRAARRTAPGTTTPLAVVVEEFGLSRLATDILLIAAAPTIWGELARLYGILTNDPDRPLCDELLIGQILGPERGSRHDVARELDREAPLIRWGLLRPGEGKTRPFISLTVDPIVVRRLRGDTFEHAEAEEGSAIRPADRTLQEIVAPPALLHDMLTRLNRAPQEGFARIVMRGRLGSGRRCILATLAEAQSRPLGIIDTTLLPRDPRYLIEALRTELQRAVLRGWLPCVVGIDEVSLEDPAVKDRIRELFRSHPGPIAFRVGTDATPPIDPGYLQFDIPALNESDRLACWRDVASRRNLRIRDMEGLAARFRIGVGVIERVATRVAARTQPAEGENGEALPVDSEIEAAVRQHLEVRLGTVANRVTRLATWSSVVLPPDVLDTVREFIGRIKHRRVVYERWGFDRTMSTSRGLTALFQGGPGTGKTMVAGIIARELQLDLYRIDLSRIMSKWIGETERNLASVFDAAEDGQAIILFDEADSLFAKRTEVKSSVDRYANLEVNYLLQRLDSFDGIAILTTNFGGSIDAAFKRRLSLRLTFPFPDEEMREELWRVHLPPEMPTSGEFKLAELARKYQLSGGYIRNATLRAAFLAAQEETPLTHDHLERAVKLEFKELGKLADTGVLE